MSSPVVDAHVHLFPPEICNSKDDFCARDEWFGITHSGPMVRMPSVDDLLESMDEAGVDVSIVAAWPWMDPELCRDHNDFLAEICRDHPRLEWLGIVNPDTASAVQEVERLHHLGACGVGELNADAQGFTWEVPERELTDFANACIDLDMPVMAHVSEPVGRSYSGKGTATPPKILQFLDRHPRLKFVAAHWGGGLPFYELMPDVALTLANVTYDSAASTYLYRPEVFSIVSRIVGPKRILWGSDYPILGQRRFLKKARAYVPDDELADITGQNAVDIYKSRIAGEVS